MQFLHRTFCVICGTSCVVTAADMITNRSFLSIGFIASICYAYCLCMVPSFVRVAKRKPAVFTLRACCSRQLEIGCLFDLYPGNRLTGKLPSPSRFPYCLHCKNAANSAPQKLIRISHSEPCSIQMMRIAVTQNVMAVSDFCDIALAPFSGRR